MIRYVTPYATDGNLAKAYNDEMKRALPGEYVGFYDGDAMPVDPKWGHHIESIVKQNPGNYYTCYATRTNCGWQRLPEHWGHNDIDSYRQFALSRKEVIGNEVEDHTNSQLWSGHLMIIPADKWIPLSEERGLLGIDNMIHKNAIEHFPEVKILLMKGVIFYHYYSNFSGGNGHRKRDKSHLMI